MIEAQDGLMNAIRDRFHHVDSCPYQGERVFFENAGGALTLKSVVETSTRLATIPDNQGRDNPGSHELVRIINKSRDDMRVFFNAPKGQIFVGEKRHGTAFPADLRCAARGGKTGCCHRQFTGTSGNAERGEALVGNRRDRIT